MIPYLLRTGPVLLKVLKWIAAVAGFFCNRIPIEPRKVSEKIVFLFTIASVFACACVEFFNYFLGYDILAEGLGILQTRWQTLSWAIVFVAVLPPVAAFFERKKGASLKYIAGNCFFNLVGAACAYTLLKIVYETIENFSFLKEFYVGDIALSFLPVCLWIALSYQQVEQEKEQEKRKEKLVPDHSTSLSCINQILNVLHLVNVYFWSLVSAELIICYTLYCYIHHAPQKLSGRYLLGISVVLFFFYLCGTHTHVHLYLLFLAAVPAILICVVQWMSWLAVDGAMVGLQLGFIVFHFGIYMLIIYVHEKRTRPKGAKNGKQDPLRVLKNWAWEIKEDHKKLALILGQWFYFVVFVILAISYTIFWIAPSTLERVPYSKAVNHICMICGETEEAESLLTEIRESEWYDDTLKDPDLDKTRYLLFLYDNIRGYMIEKGVIGKTDTTVSYERLNKWVLDTIEEERMQNRGEVG